MSTDVESQEVEALIEGDDARLVLVEDQASGRQPCREPRLDLLGLVPGVAEGDEIVGVSDQHGGARPRPSIGVVADSGGLLHPVQGDVQQHGADHPALRSSLLRGGELTALDHARLQPLPDHPPRGERAEHGQQVIVSDVVKRRRQICVEHPPSLRALALGDLIDRFDRVMAAAARPKSIGPRLKPRLPLGLQRARDACLVHAVEDHGDGDFKLHLLQ
jgi:hypothetical protein